MTETQRQISNEQVLDLADNQVALVESELGRLDTLQENLHAARETTGTLTLENKRIRDNVDGLEKSKRIAKLRDNAAAISLEENDALMIEQSIESAKTRVIALGQAAKSKCAEILWWLTAARRSNARAALESILDFSHVGVLGQNMELGAHSVLALKDLEYYFKNSWVSHEPESQISFLHQLRDRFRELRTICETEPGLTIPPVAAAQPVETPVTESKPATLSGALVAV